MRPFQACITRAVCRGILQYLFPAFAFAVTDAADDGTADWTVLDANDCNRELQGDRTDPVTEVVVDFVEILLTINRN